MYKTKEAAALLHISPTTLKRWVFAFQPWFRKDALGHYLFDTDSILILREIQLQLAQGKMMSDIKLGEPRVANLSQQDEQAALLESGKGPFNESEQVNLHNPDLSMLPETVIHDKKGISEDELNEKLNLRISALESEITRKANDVVSFQVLQHRRELDELRQEIYRLSGELVKMEIILAQQAAAASTNSSIPKTKRRKLWSVLQSAFF